MKKKKFFKELAFYVVLFGGILSARASLADHYHVPTGSMHPTVHVGDRVFVDKTAFGIRIPPTRTFLFGTPPQRGDIVVLESPEEEKILLKRVVGIPGDVVAVRSGHVRVDGMTLQDEAAFAGSGGPDFGPVAVPDRSFLVMGDNRSNSHDGRRFGFVTQNAILGRVLGIYWRDGAPVWKRVN